jgi:hypothetical protein
MRTNAAQSFDIPCLGTVKAAVQRVPDSKAESQWFVPVAPAIHLGFQRSYPAGTAR